MTTSGLIAATSARTAAWSRIVEVTNVARDNVVIAVPLQGAADCASD